ncbi:putative cell-division initiation protein [Candidatus Arthromitus sp. SFB-mouse-Yit]|nr:putative cell-division initiation protein [Candidatus Arthromitus sp. SFB-mouse-Yit]
MKSVKITPVDITNKEFRKMLRGYDPEEVDEFLDQIVEDYEELFKENSLLKEKINAMNEKIEHYSKIESTIQNTLLLAQNAAEQAKVSSQKEADMVIKHANDSAKKILDKAHTDVVSITQEYDRLKQEFVKFRAKFRNFITVQMDTFEDLEKDFIKNYNLNNVRDKANSEDDGIAFKDKEIEQDNTEIISNENDVTVQTNLDDNSFEHENVSSRLKTSQDVDSDLENIKKFFISES